MKNILLLLLFIFPGISSAQEECYTEWEMKMVEEINSYRKKKNLSEFVYSPVLTKGAIYYLQHPDDYTRPTESVGYKGHCAPMFLSFSFEFMSASEALKTILDIPLHVQFLEDTYTYYKYTSVAVARIGNKISVILGDAVEVNETFPLCAPAINTKNYEWIFTPNEDFWEMAPYHVGKYIAVRNINQWGICDTNGRLVLPFRHEWLSMYDTNSFLIGSEVDKIPYQVIDTNGNVLFDLGKEGKLFLGKKGVRIAYEGNFNYLETNEGKRISEKYPDMYGIGRDLIAFQKNGLYGIMDYDAQILVQPKYGEIFTYSEDMAAVKVGSKWGFIDTTFTMVIQPVAMAKEELYFNDGLVIANINGKYGYMNKKGELVIKPQYSYAGQFTNGLAPVFNAQEKGGYINTKGEVVIPLKYIAAEMFESGYGAVMNDDLLYAIVNTSGEIITDHEFNQIQPNENGVLKVKYEGRWGMIRITKK